MIRQLALMAVAALPMAAWHGVAAQTVAHELLAAENEWAELRATKDAQGFAAPYAEDGMRLPPPPPGAPGLFALSDEAALRAFAEAGGLAPGEIFDVDTPWHYPDEATYWRGIGSSGVAVKAIEHSGEAAFKAAMTEFIAPFRKADGSIGFGASARYLVATPTQTRGQ
ncbi:MAG: hypothetical protein ACK4HF_02550 [Paracoccaceae bacterium]